jgi:hypothetical protein
MTSLTPSLQSDIRRGNYTAVAEAIQAHAEAAGFIARINCARTTESVYVAIGRPSAAGGLDTLMEVRLSGHRAPWNRALGSKRDRISGDAGQRVRRIEVTDHTQRDRITRVAGILAAITDMAAGVTPDVLWDRAGRRAGLVWG